MNYGLLVLIALLIAAPILTAAQAQERDASEVVLGLEAQRLAAMVDVDSELLERVLSNDLTYTHSNGLVQTKKELVESLDAKRLDYRSIDIDHVAVRLYGNAAVVTGAAHIEIVVNVQTVKASLLFTNVWIREGDAWQMVAYQSTPMKTID